MTWRIENMKKRVLVIISAFCVLILAFSIYITVKNTRDMQKLIEGSIKAQLHSACQAVREITDEYDLVNLDFDEIESSPAYSAAIAELTNLAKNTGAKYIYGLKYVDGECVFFMDIDTVDNSLFEAYTPSSVHTEAFEGYETAGISNMEDEFGSFHTGAIPIFVSGKVAGIVAVDIEDRFVEQSYKDSNTNIAVLIAVQVIVLCLLVGYISYLLKKLHEMQDELYRQAHFDLVTGLPNRQYLFEFLRNMKKENEDLPYALIFIDLDNFKLVNDVAGHDAGDALLKSIGEFLQGLGPIAKSFRPLAGPLNISARVGGDEFILVVPGIETEKQAMAFCDNLLEEFQKSQINRHIKEFSVGMSVGIALYPYHSNAHDVLIKYADIAMYHAKKSGKNRSVFYNEKLTPKDEK